MKRILLLPFVLGLLLMACTERKDFERRLDWADSLITQKNSDSAYHMLCVMTEMAEKMPKGLRMRHLYLRTLAHKNADKKFSDDSICTVLAEYYDRHGTPNERMNVYFMKGLALRHKNDLPAAINAFNEAVTAADTLADDCNFRLYGLVHMHIAYTFCERYITEEALEALETAERFVKDSLVLLEIRSIKAEALLKALRIDEGLELFEEVVNGYKAIGMEDRAASAGTFTIIQYSQKGEFAKAKAHIDAFETVVKPISDEGELTPGLESWYNIKGHYYQEKGTLDSAEYCFRQFAKVAKNLLQRYRADWGLTLTFQKMGLADSTAKYAIQAHYLSSNLFDEKTSQEMQHAHAQNDYSRHEDIALRKEKEAQAARIHLRNGFMGGGVTMLILLWLIHQLRKQIREKKRELNKAEEQIRENIGQVEKLSDLLAQKAEAICKLNQQLNQNAINVERVNAQARTIQLLNEKIEEYREKEAAPLRDYQLNDESVVLAMREMARKKTTSGTKDWNALFAIVEQYYPVLRQIRERTDVNHTEYQVCILTLLGFELNEIMSLIGRDNSYLTTARRRMVPKIFKQPGGAKDFDRLMMELKNGKHADISV